MRKIERRFPAWRGALLGLAVGLGLLALMGRL